MKISKKLLKDNKSRKEPFFIREKGERVYTGFPLIPETETHGFVYGGITDFLEPDSNKACTSGDGFIQAPDGSRAGLVWQVGDSKKIETLIKPEEERWGVYSVNFPKPVKTLNDLAYNFRAVLPLLVKKYNQAKI